ncbi:hypothetical protein H072_2502 [Dactylellina haptotyla CBS 200.50]|uniref:Histidine kinase n=1 Tax=Dactylellina haptotyla (strain CBS 200.50) TaxID=1284197 RepID=S8C727_DACHA|nr:hypothetical protein H072_2502 [Dactylellina haptotyla CBS 200.50]
MATMGISTSRDISELGIESLAFRHSPARLLIADSSDSIVGINDAARRFLFPGSPLSEPISSLVPKLKDLPLNLLDDELKTGDTSHNNVDAVTIGTHPEPNVPVRIESSVLRTSAGTIYTSLCLTPLGADADGERNTTAVVPKLMHMKDKILDHMHELVVFCLSRDGNLLVTNKAAQALLGDSTPVVGRGIDWLKERWKVYEPDFSAEIPFERWGIYALLTEGEIVRQTIGYYDPQGQPKIIELGGEPIKDDDGNLVAGIVWLKDETSWHTKGEEKFRRICNSIPQMMFALTPDIKPEYFNQRWYEYTGMSIEETSSDSMGSNPFWNICHPEDQVAVEDAWKLAVVSETPVQIQFRCRDSEGSYRWMLCRANCTFDKDGRASKWYGTLTDINDRKMTQLPDSTTPIKSTDVVSTEIEAVEEQCRLRNQLSQVIVSSQLCVMTIENTPDRRIATLDGRMIFPVGDKLAIGANFLEAFKGYDQFTQPLERILTKPSEMIGPDITAEIEMKGKWFRCRFTPTGPRNVPAAGRPESISPTKTSPIESIVLVAADVTARYVADKEKSQLEERESAAVKESQLKSTFLANASHEIRTPISQIIGMSEVLLETHLESQQKDFTTNINRSANALKAIISDILDLSKIEAKKMTISNSAFDLSLLLSDIIEMFKVTTSKKGLNFEHISILDESDHLVIGDQGRVRQILTNLMGNAFKFTSDGFIRMTTMRDYEQSDPDRVRIRFIVEDSGVGISDEALKKIFLPFSQADHTTSAKFGGTGLGLSISKELVELMHGEIALERSKGSPGCVAWFSIPFQRYDGRKDIEKVHDSDNAMHRFRFEMERAMMRHDEEASSVGSISPAPSPRAKAAQLYHAAAASSSKSKSPLPASLMPPPDHPASSTPKGVTSPIEPRPSDPARILLIEDDAIIRSVIVKHLQGFGCKVYTADNGQLGLDLLEKTSKRGDLPDLVFTDCRMPVMDGYTFATRVRTHPVAVIRNLPVVAMSAATTDEEKAHCTEVGMSHFLPKPAKKEELYEVLSLFLKPKRKKKKTSSG